MSFQVGSELLKRLLEAVALDYETVKERNLTHLFEFVNGSLRLVNGTMPRDDLIMSILSNNTFQPRDPPADYINSVPSVKAFFYCLYSLIFLIGVAGNALVCYVVIRNKNMQTVTNIFIMNLALSDILLCMFSVPFTPLYLLSLSGWVFGKLLCHLLPYAQGVSVYISAFTLMSIAIDRFFVIIYPFKPRMEIKICLLIVACVWIAAGVLMFPYGWFMDLTPGNNFIYCEEVWPQDESKWAFGFSTSVLQFVIPFTIISFCYMRVCSKLRERARCKPGAKSVRKEELERERTRRTNRMLISMVVIFGASWLPLNINNLVQDFYQPAGQWQFARAFFMLGHAIAMSSTCYNPFLYAWLNENFRKEFKRVLPCFRSARRRDDTASRKAKANKQTARDQPNPCNGLETIQMQEQSAADRPEDEALAHDPEPGTAGGDHFGPEARDQGSHHASSRPSCGTRSAAVYVPSNHSVRLKLTDKIAEDSL